MRAEPGVVLGDVLQRTCAGHYLEQAAGVVDHLIVGVSCGDRLVDVRRRGHLAREVSVEVIAVQSVTEQP
jgi:hypothetical protein